MDEKTPITLSQKIIDRTPKYAGLVIEICLIALIVTGILFRFNWVNWNQDTNLHPDEYGLTNTLTQLSLPKDLAGYFNTRISPLSPYAKYDLAGEKTKDGPDNRMRWGQLPITIIRTAGEITDNTGYGEIRLLGRKLSALADTLSLLLIFLIGLKLYGYRAGLLASALSALAVMQIQQSHFMTVDNFGSFFTTLGLFACVQIAQNPLLKRTEQQPGKTSYQIDRSNWGWYLLFGAAFGLALACKVNLLPVGGLVLVAAFMSIADLKLGSMADLRRILLVVGVMLAVCFVTAGLIFRVAQPMSFRTVGGNTGFFNLQPNPDWVESMKVASAESSGQGGGPPGEQWAHRPAIIFPLVNMVVWGMGVPLGLAAWLGFAFALWQLLRKGTNWRAHLLPLVWTGGYFLFMGSRWVKSVRYFLPIYPFLCLFAAWGLLQLWHWSVNKENPGKRKLRIFFSSALIGLTVLGSLAWAISFVQAVYLVPHTRVQATQWMFQNIPGPFQLGLTLNDGTTYREPLEAPDGLQVNATNAYRLSFRLPVSGQLTSLVVPHVQSMQPGVLHVIIASDSAGNNALTNTKMVVGPDNSEVKGEFQPVFLEKDQVYTLIAFTESSEPITISRVMIANESWDEGLPVPFENRNPFGQLYRGKTMQIRWQDDEHKREEMLSTLADADYLILPSQRAIWSTCRIPKTYPMTMNYYRALFDGRLGFDLLSEFGAPLKVGPLWISDVGGTAAWNQTPVLPLFNSSWLAAEEAFSIYDHPPVWIFKKRADFTIEQAQKILDSADLSLVVVQSALNADGDWCPAQ
jgi:hypothetical protein